MPETPGSGSRGPALRSTGGLLVLLLVGVAAVLFFRLGDRPVSGHAESRVYGAAASIDAGSGWLAPAYEGRVRIEKPPLYTWLVAAGARASGGLTPLWFRLPAACAALGLVVLAFLWGHLAGGPLLGLNAAAALALMVQLYEYGRRGVAETLLAFCATACLVTFAQIERERRPRLLPVFALFLGLAFLAKATAALLVVGLPIALYLLAQGKLRCAWSGRVAFWIAAGLGLGMSWYVAVLLTVPGAWETLYSELVLPVGVTTAGATTAHFKGPHYFLVKIFSIAFPAVVLLPIAIRRGIETRFWRQEPMVRFAAITFLSVFVVFSILPQKQRHYLLPVLPAAAVVLGDAIGALQRSPGAARWVRWGGLGLSIVVAGVAVLVALYYAIVLAMPSWTILAAATVGGALSIGILLAGLRGRARSVVVLFLVSFWGAELVYQGSLSIWESYFHTRTVAQRSDYDPEHWAEVFQKYPFLKSPLGARHGRRKHRERSRVAPVAAPPAAHRTPESTGGGIEETGDARP